MNAIKEFLKIGIGATVAVLALYYAVYPSCRVLFGMQDAIEKMDQATLRMVPARALITDYTYETERRGIHAGVTFDYRQRWLYSIVYRRNDGIETVDSVEYETHQKAGPEAPELAKGFEKGDSVDIYYDPQRETESELAVVRASQSLTVRPFFNGMFIIIALLGLGVAAIGTGVMVSGLRRLRDPGTPRDLPND